MKRKYKRTISITLILLGVLFILILFLPPIYQYRANIAKALWTPYCFFKGEKTYAKNLYRGTFPHVLIGCYEEYSDGGIACNSGDQCQSSVCIATKTTEQEIYELGDGVSILTNLPVEAGYCHGNAISVCDLPYGVILLNNAEGSNLPRPCPM